MVRRYDEQVQVQMEDGQPAAFVWRGRVYVVRAVQSRWFERRVWWREAAASALLGLRVDPAGSVETASAGAVATVSPPSGAEREVWRVEAMAGRTSPVGVYELVHDPCAGEDGGATGPGGPVGSWLLSCLDD